MHLCFLGLFIEINGEGNVHWVEKVRAEQGRTKKVHYKNAERYFSEKITLIEGMYIFQSSFVMNNDWGLFQTISNRKQL